MEDTHSEWLGEGVGTDAKKRLSVRAAGKRVGSTYIIYRNGHGLILRDPVRAVPARETWLFENKRAFASVKRGMEESATGRIRNLGSVAVRAKG